MYAPSEEAMGHWTPTGIEPTDYDDDAAANDDDDDDDDDDMHCCRRCVYSLCT